MDMVDKSTKFTDDNFDTLKCQTTVS